MKFNSEEINSLPTISELVIKLKNEEKDIDSNRHLGFLSPPFPMPLDLDPDVALKKNNGTDDQFIVSRLGSGRFALKPNLKNRKFLYRGQSQYHEPCKPNLFRGGQKESYIIENIKKEEFQTLVKSHPLIKMFEEGIKLPSSSHTYFFEMNYYGLAQHYSYKTALIDFTSEIDVAAFFATTYCDENDTYFPLTDDNGYGVIYTHEITGGSFKSDSFTSIGLQVFPRSGSQKGFLYCSPLGHDMNSSSSIKKRYFKHSSEESEKCYSKMISEQNKLFPKDELHGPSKRILEDKDISGEIFTGYIQNENLDSYQETNFIKGSGYNIVNNKQINFSSDDLTSYYKDIENGIWKEFCDQIHFPGDNGTKLQKDLLNLPKDPLYQKYFKP